MRLYTRSIIFHIYSLYPKYQYLFLGIMETSILRLFSGVLKERHCPPPRLEGCYALDNFNGNILTNAGCSRHVLEVSLFRLNTRAFRLFQSLKKLEQSLLGDLTPSSF